MSGRETSDELRQLAHDVRNALNGVAVNLEVARTRAARGADVAELAPFVETAAQQLNAAARLHKRYADLVAEITAAPFERGAGRADASGSDGSDSHSESTTTHGS